MCFVQWFACGCMGFSMCCICLPPSGQFEVVSGWESGFLFLGIVVTASSPHCVAASLWSCGCLEFLGGVCSLAIFIWVRVVVVCLNGPGIRHCSLEFLVHDICRCCVLGSDGWCVSCVKFMGHFLCSWDGGVWRLWGFLRSNKPGDLLQNVDCLTLVEHLLCDDFLVSVCCACGQFRCFRFEPTCNVFCGICIINPVWFHHYVFHIWQSAMRKMVPKTVASSKNQMWTSL